MLVNATAQESPLTGLSLTFIRSIPARLNHPAKGPASSSRLPETPWNTRFFAGHSLRVVGLTAGLFFLRTCSRATARGLQPGTPAQRVRWGDGDSSSGRDA